MSAPQSPALVDAAAPAPPVESVGGLLVRWLGWGVLAGVALPLLLVVIGFVWNGFLVYLAVPLMIIGAAVGGTVGALAGATAVIARGGGRPAGYGPVAPTRPPTPLPVRALLVAWLAALGVVWAGGVVYATALSGARLELAIVVGVAAASLGVALVATGVLAIPHARVAAVTAIALGPILAIGGSVTTIGASFAVTSAPQESSLEEQPLVQGSPPGGLTLSEPEDSPRIPAPTPLYGDATLAGLTLLSEFEEAARYSLVIAQVDDPDIPAGTVFPASVVRCAWDPGEEAKQATADIWFDTADDAAAIQRVREYWTTDGYTLVVDDTDLVVVAGATGLIGAQFSIETTWDDKLRLRMQSVCIPG